jgi:DNA-binding NtrC family response regulator
MDALRRHHFPGNVRELRNLVEAALVLGRIDIEGAAITPLPAADPALPTYRDARAAALAAFEIDYLRRLLDQAGGNVSEAARRARMDRPYLSMLLKKHGLR